MTIEKPKVEASLSDALIPIVILIILLGGSVYLFEDNSSFGPNQIALLVAMGIAAIIGLKNGYSWDDIEQGIIKGISRSLGAILIHDALGAVPPPAPFPFTMTWNFSSVPSQRIGDKPARPDK